MAQYLVGLDGGTTGCKTCIFDLDGKLVGSDYREYPSYYPEPGWVEQTTEDLLPNFYDSIKTVSYTHLSRIILFGQRQRICRKRCGSTAVNLR